MNGRKIVILLSGLGAGGAERVVALLTAHWIEAGAQVSILTFDAETDPVYHDFGPAVRLGRLNIPASRPWQRVRGIRRIIRHDQPDVVISFLTKINVLTLAATVGLKCPVIISERNNPLRQPMHPLWSIAARFLYHRASAIICQTNASISVIPSGVRARIAVIGNPVSRFPWQPAAESSQLRMVAVGRLTEQKGFDILIEAFGQIAMHHPQWSLEIWGDGPDRPALQAAVDRLGLADRIQLAGWSEQPGQWIERANLFVLSSRYEGFPNVLAEAMAAGLPVVATNCAFGPADLVSPNVDGLLVPSEDPARLAAALDSIFSDSGLRHRLGQRARAVVDRFGADKIARQWDIVLTRSLTVRRVGGAATEEEVTLSGSAVPDKDLASHLR